MSVQKILLVIISRLFWVTFGPCFLNIELRLSPKMVSNRQSRQITRQISYKHRHTHTSTLSLLDLTFFVLLPPADKSSSEGLLLWCKKMAAPYQQHFQLPIQVNSFKDRYEKDKSERDREKKWERSEVVTESLIFQQHIVFKMAGCYWHCAQHVWAQGSSPKLAIRPTQRSLTNLRSFLQALTTAITTTATFSPVALQCTGLKLHFRWLRKSSEFQSCWHHKMSWRET